MLFRRVEHAFGRVVLKADQKLAACTELLKGGCSSGGIGMVDKKISELRFACGWSRFGAGGV